MESMPALVAIIAVATITPGPNNFIVLAAGARGGLPSAGPLIGAVIAGGLVLIALTWAGAALLFEAEPRLRLLLTVTGSAYLAWLGVVMIRHASSPAGTANELPQPDSALPRTWLGVAAFQLFNPKAWVLVVTATAAITRNGWQGFSVLAAVFVTLSGICLALWALVGSTIGAFLGDGRSKRCFDRAMGGLLIVSAALLIADVV
ncbi:MAG: LysE family translocator [Gammaproteobacteria bacterium]